VLCTGSAYFRDRHRRDGFSGQIRAWEHGARGQTFWADITELINLDASDQTVFDRDI